ncbi:head-tail connector protein [Pseudomonas guariconensis]|uniref:Phage gp6-like head-tail connector protein n=1 Tax=Pseudomonas guariconensis TaxID=1288410 RepID=A0AAX0VPY2_9PSED|nr:head-tail connector protein [Pseudomonas guariconensis]PLV13073.1 phage gp6-like head-tail connector protein [Pseudomonas guariconensis]PLV21495.1 phage gp6-like head-tail connector protein [Pseudomonas guariconensis]PLV26612.1 phage gp6-like head-tail connector protein [Pseudomonas guariconensis]
MSVIAIEVAMHHLRAEFEDQVLVQTQLDAAEETAMQFLNRRFYLDQDKLDEARAGVQAIMQQAKAANAEAVVAAEAEQDHSLRCRLLEHARQALANAYDQADTIAYGMVLNPAIQAACLLKLGHLFANREEVVTGTITAELPLASQHLLMPYRIRMGV